ncbi:MAG: NADH-quinone oxidoreductase subunit J [Planctomycetaceae bacterium]
MNAWLNLHPLQVTAVLLWVAGVLWLMPVTRRTTQRPKLPGLLLTVAGVFAFTGSGGHLSGDLVADGLFWLFGSGALVCGVLTITSRSAEYSALWFALVTLCTCGLFLLRSAPFLAAATMIVYAGAVIVTFLFVVMLAQQAGHSACDQRSHQPLLTTLAAFALLLAIIATMQNGSRQPVIEVTAMNSLSAVDEQHPAGSLQGLGRTLFSDYLFAVELAGTVLLIAAVGAIAIAPGRSNDSR